MSLTIQFIICGLVLTTVVIVNAASNSNLTNDFVHCKKSDPKFNECLKTDLNTAMHHIANDPLRIVELKIYQNSEHPVNINLKFNNIDIYNFKYTEIKELQYNPVSGNAAMNILLPNSLIIMGNYKINGEVLNVPIKGKGECKLAIDMPKVDFSTQFTPMVKNNKTYLRVDYLTFKSVTTSLQVQFNNLFDGDKTLGDNMNKFLNENWRDVLNEIQPALERVLRVTIKDKIQQFFDRIPEDEIFED